MNVYTYSRVAIFYHYYVASQFNLTVRDNTIRLRIKNAIVSFALFSGKSDESSRLYRCKRIPDKAVQKLTMVSILRPITQEGNSIQQKSAKELQYPHNSANYQL